MAKAMVSTVRPKARATPTKPMPKAGKAAASTAEPHPPKTSQAVPMNSAASLRVMTHPPFCYPWVEPYARHKAESPPPPPPGSCLLAAGELDRISVGVAAVAKTEMSGLADLA